MEETFPSEPPPISRCQRDTVSPCTGIPMDGTRDDPSICQAESSDKSAEAGMCFGLSPSCANPCDIQLHDVASGLEYLHDQPFVHSDIKSVSVSPFTPHHAPIVPQGNVLVNSDLTACIGDFGLANITSSPSISIALSTPSAGGTYRWMAPELLKSDEAGGVPQKSSKASDVYSFGMVAYEVSATITPSSRWPMAETLPGLRTLSTLRAPYRQHGHSRRHRREAACATAAPRSTRTR